MVEVDAGVEASEAATDIIAGRYRLGTMLGQGGMGTVWLAADELLGREVALKRLRLTDMPEQDAVVARQRTMREARIAATLHHPHVVTIFDVVVVNSEPWLVLEYLPSVTLGRLVRDRGTLPPFEVAAIGAQIASALAAAHRAGIVHRDVKPDNVLVAERTAKLTDFGISHTENAAAITQHGALTGTPAYLAPETARGAGTDSRSDVYALGATLYAAVEGAPPFGDTGEMLVILARISRGQAPPPRRAGPLTGLLRAMLADDPQVRPTAGQAHEALARLTDPRRPADAQSSTTVTVDRTAVGTSGGVDVRQRRRGARIAAAVAAVVLLAGAAVGATFLLRDPPATGVITDERTADPCPLVDTTALTGFGEPTLDPTNSVFAGCRADVRTADGRLLALLVEFQSPLGPEVDLTNAVERLSDLPVVREPTTGGSCRRRLILPDRHVVVVSGDGLGTTDGELCAIADSGVAAAAARISGKGISTRAPLDQVSALAGANACSLLDATALAAVPGVVADGLPGFGGWSCQWFDSSVERVTLTYYRGSPPSATVGATYLEIAGREADTLALPGNCRAEFAQRSFTDLQGYGKADQVQVVVYGSESGEELCRQATALATAAAATLPPPG